MRVLRILAGTVVGYILAAAGSLGWFMTTHHQFADEVSPGFLLATAIFGLVLSLIAGYLAAWIGASPISAYGVALILALLAARDAVTVHISHAGGSLGATWISLFVMAPAAAVGGWLWQRRAPAVRMS